jgi:hypothetical protein
MRADYHTFERKFKHEKGAKFASNLTYQLADGHPLIP